jgi:DUF4097 and DUF4098 domain-containing protein YvlB
VRGDQFESFTSEKEVRRIHWVVWTIEAVRFGITSGVIVIINQHIPGAAGDGNVSDTSGLKGPNVIVDHGAIRR